MNKFIVAEVSKTWINGISNGVLLCQQFEEIINENYKKGYNLQDWRTTSSNNGNALTETIIAVFVRQKNYIIGKTEREHQQFIKCLDCEKISYNENDVKNRYCGNCHKFHN